MGSGRGWHTPHQMASSMASARRPAAVGHAANRNACVRACVLQMARPQKRHIPSAVAPHTQQRTLQDYRSPGVDSHTAPAPRRSRSTGRTPLIKEGPAPSPGSAIPRTGRRQRRLCRPSGWRLLIWRRRRGEVAGEAFHEVAGHDQIHANCAGRLGQRLVPPKTAHG